MYLILDPCMKAQCVNNSTCVTDMDSLSGYKCLCNLNSAGMNMFLPLRVKFGSVNIHCKGSNGKLDVEYLKHGITSPELPL